MQYKVHDLIDGLQGLDDTNTERLLAALRTQGVKINPKGRRHRAMQKAIRLALEQLDRSRELDLDFSIPKKDRVSKYAAKRRHQQRDTDSAPADVQIPASNGREAFGSFLERVWKRRGATVVRVTYRPKAENGDKNSRGCWKVALLISRARPELPLCLTLLEKEGMLPCRDIRNGTSTPLSAVRSGRYYGKWTDDGIEELTRFLSRLCSMKGVYVEEL